MSQPGVGCTSRNRRCEVNDHSCWRPRAIKMRRRTWRRDTRQRAPRTSFPVNKVLSEGVLLRPFYKMAPGTFPIVGSSIVELQNWAHAQFMPLFAGMSCSFIYTTVCLLCEGTTKECRAQPDPCLYWLTLGKLGWAAMKTTRLPHLLSCPRENRNLTKKKASKLIQLPCTCASLWWYHVCYKGRIN